MAQPSPVSIAFHQAFEASFAPLLKAIGLASSKAKNVKPGLVVELWSRALANDARLEVCLWCDGGTGDHLRLRVDHVTIVNGVECSEQIDLRVPWSDASAPQAQSLDFSGKEFLPRESTEQLQKAITFLAGGFAASSETLASAIPELADDFRSTKNVHAWTAAVERAADLWKNRHTRGGVDGRSVPAKIIFVGANLVTLEADGERLTFRFDTRDFDRNAPLTVSGWIRTPAGTRRATRLIAGDKTWHFDASGALSVV